MTNAMTGIDSQTSFNFAIAKILAIYLVAAGHFFEGTLLWIPVTVGLFVFAYSSAFFTSKKYSRHDGQLEFWRSKVWRLAAPFWLSQMFLLMVFVASNRSGIWTWQTLVHWLGFSGWLNWIGISNSSPFGAGLWFFSVLLIFYVTFPIISTWLDDHRRAMLSLPVAVVLAVLMSEWVNVGHALWITIFAFWFGVHSARYPLHGSARTWFAVAGTCATAMLLLNFSGIKWLNNALLICVSAAAVMWLERMRLPRRLFAWMLVLSPCVLEIYLIHTYLFVDLGLPMPVRFIASLALITACALALSRVVRLAENLARNARPSYS